MAARQTSSQSLKSIAGAALFGLGLIILLGNLDGIAASLSNHLGASRNPALATLPSLVLEASRVLETYAFDHQLFLRGLEQILVSFWPLILVIIGAVLLRDAFASRSRTAEPARALQQQETAHE